MGYSQRHQFVTNYLQGPQMLNIGVGDDFVGLGDRAVHLDIDRWKYNRFVQGDAHRLPFKNDSFDTVVLGDVIEHFVNPQQALEEAKRVGRRIIATVFEEWRLGSEGQHIEKGHEVFPCPTDLEEFKRKGLLLDTVPESVISHNPHINQFTNDNIVDMVKSLDMMVLDFCKRPELLHEGHTALNWHFCLARPCQKDAGVCVIIPYFNSQYNENLTACLKSLQNQTKPPKQIIVCDDSLPDDRPEVMQICEKHGVTDYTEFSFKAGVPQWSRKFNYAYQHVQEEMILICCSNWVLEPKWIETMVNILLHLGKGNMVAGDSSRAIMGDVDGTIYDWFAGFPDLFLIPNPYHLVMPDYFNSELKFPRPPEARNHVYNMDMFWDYMDEGFLNLMWKQDWLPWDEDFDRVGAWHAVCEWGFRLFINGLRLWIKRGLNAGHGKRHPLPQWNDQTIESFKMYMEKLKRSKKVHLKFPEVK